MNLFMNNTILITHPFLSNNKKSKQTQAKHDKNSFLSKNSCLAKSPCKKIYHVSPNLFGLRHPCFAVKEQYVYILLYLNGARFNDWTFFWAIRLSVFKRVFVCKYVFLISSFHFISFIRTQHHDTKLKIFAQDIKEQGDDKCSLSNNLAI